MDKSTHDTSFIDSNLEFALDDYRDILLEHLFTKKDIKKWKNNEEVIINKKFIPLLKGHWSRKFNSDFDKKLNLKSIKMVQKAHFLSLLDNQSQLR